MRYEPFNLRYGYLYFRNRWLQCLTDKHPELEGRTEKEQRVISAEKRHLNRLISRELPARAIKRARDLASAEGSQSEQSAKINLVRKQQSQNHIVLARINGGLGVPRHRRVHDARRTCHELRGRKHKRRDRARLVIRQHRRE